MKSHERILALVLLALLGATAAGWLLTRPVPQVTGQGNRRPGGPRQPQVDQQPLATAQQLAGLASTRQEQSLARIAISLADREIDLAFATALRNAVDHPPALTGPALEVQKRLNDLDNKVAADKTDVARLGDEAGHASGARKDQLLKQQELAQAQQALDEDDLSDAREDLERAGGNPQGEIQKEVADHEASMQHAQAPAPQGAAAPAASPASAPEPATGLPPSLVSALPIGSPAENIVSQVHAWRKLRNDEDQVWQAQRDAQTLAGRLTQDHQQLDATVNAEKPKQSALTQQAEQALNAGGQDAQQSATDALRSVRRLAGDQTTLADYDKRILAAQRLGTVYGRWAASIETRRRALLHDLMWLIAWILLIALAAICIEVLLARILARSESQRDRVHTLVAIFRFTVRALAFLLILIVIFGPPNQLATVLALATAGITVALKDFIVGILGYFVLVGRHGIRPGDWVEINGVTGEVVEVGVFSTVLLETGNWSDESKLTGRRVTFNNSYAIEGHYFNFSTSARWIWDELQVIIPFGADPFAIADSVGKLAAADTAANGQQAQKELESTSGHPLHSFSAAPAVSVKPDPQGAMISVRYLTKAGEQHAVSARLYRRVVEMLGDHKVAPLVKTSSEQPDVTVKEGA